MEKMKKRKINLRLVETETYSSMREGIKNTEEKELILKSVYLEEDSMAYKLFELMCREESTRLEEIANKNSFKQFGKWI